MSLHAAIQPRLEADRWSGRKSSTRSRILRYGLRAQALPFTLSSPVS